MPRKRHKAEEIVAKLRQVDVLVSQGQSVADAVRSIGVTEVTYHRWRQEYGGLKADQVRRLKALEAENARLRRAVADLTLDKLILKEAASGNVCMVRPRPASGTLLRALNVLRQCIRPRGGARSFAPGPGGYPLSGAPGY
jgi:putative transposase